jgi:xanthine dehydrogenase YagR molybdenum-binding subunit
MSKAATKAPVKVKRGRASDSGAPLGSRQSRIDGPAKITGSARYAVEHHPANMAHAVIVQSTIPSGHVRAIDKKAAEAAPGVILILTPDNIMPLKSATTWLDTPGPEGPYLALTKEINFTGQHVAAVVAETFEQATGAAALVKIDSLRRQFASSMNTGRRANIMCRSSRMGS